MKTASPLARWFSGRTLVIAAPYAWLLAFFLLPFLIVFKISVSEMETVILKTIRKGRRKNTSNHR